MVIVSVCVCVCQRYLEAKRARKLDTLTHTQTHTLASGKGGGEVKECSYQNAHANLAFTLQLCAHTNTNQKKNASVFARIVLMTRRHSSCDGLAVLPAGSHVK